MARSIWHFCAPGRIVFGCGALHEVGPLAARMGIRRPFLVADVHLLRAGIVDRAVEVLRRSRLEPAVFDGGHAEPSFACAEEAVHAARAAAPDAVIGLGGGSNMDVAKITAAVLAHRGRFQDYVGFDRIPGPVLPLIAIPTTSGTGSEVSHAAVLTDQDNAIKVSTLSPYLRPQLAIVDPELTYSCPPRVTADSGMDALTHAIESLTATRFSDIDLKPGELTPYEGKTPLPDLLAEEAIRLIGRHLPAVVADPADHAARAGMSRAALLAGLAFSNAAVALVHAMEYPLGGAVHCSHGAGNALLLPHVMRCLLPVRSAEYARVAACLGAGKAGDVPAVAAEKAIAAVDRLREECGIPARIRDFGGRREQLPGFAVQAHAIKRLMTLTPRPVTEADILAIYEQAF
jgi:alcohol dehydrogenase class IV